MSLVLFYLLLNNARHICPTNKMFIHQCFFVIVSFYLYIPYWIKSWR